MVRVLVACEFSGIVRDAFRVRGHDAWSCDLLPTATPGKHHQGDVRDVLEDGWDMMIAHPPCTHLSVSGARWFESKREEQAEALEFIAELISADIPRVAVENPVSIISTRMGPPTQIVHPWQFGHKEMKSTCLWLHWLPVLKPTNVVGPPPDKSDPERKLWERIWRMPPKGWSGNSTRAMERSKTFQGIADAMADQWGCL